MLDADRLFSLVSALASELGPLIGPPQRPPLRLVREDDPPAAKVRLPEDPDEKVARAYREHAAYVARIALRLLGRRDQADDLVQDVFLQAHRKLDQLNEPGALRGWLATTAVRMATRKLARRRVLRSLGLESEPEYHEVADHAASPDQRALLTQVYRVLDTMPAEVRSAWTLRMIEGESIDRVAELLGVSDSTAKRRIRDGQAIIDKAFGVDKELRHVES